MYNIFDYSQDSETVCTETVYSETWYTYNFINRTLSCLHMKCNNKWYAELKGFKMILKHKFHILSIKSIMHDIF